MNNQQINKSPPQCGLDLLQSGEVLLHPHHGCSHQPPSKNQLSIPFGKSQARSESIVTPLGKNQIRINCQPLNQCHQNQLFHLFEDHPLDAGQAAHLRRSMDRRHPILGSSVQVAPGLLHQVLEHVEVPLLGGQVHRGHGILHSRIGAGKQKGIIFQQRRQCG